MPRSEPLPEAEVDMGTWCMNTTIMSAERLRLASASVASSHRVWRSGVPPEKSGTRELFDSSSLRSPV